MLANLDSDRYIAPIAFTDIQKNHELLSTELFGPILAVQRVSSFSEALEKTKQTEYALTGAVFSRSPANIKKAYREFIVGNLYINRQCTGALVARQPFGGHKLSGIGMKAGGPNYLKQFVCERVIAENALRKGFAPDNSCKKTEL